MKLKRTLLEAGISPADELKLMKSLAIKLQQRLIDELPDCDVSIAGSSSLHEIALTISLNPRLIIRICRNWDWNDTATGWDNSMSIKISRSESSPSTHEEVFQPSDLNLAVKRIKSMVINTSLGEQSYKVSYSAPIPAQLQKQLADEGKQQLPMQGSVHTGKELITKKNAPFFMTPNEYRRYFGGKFRHDANVRFGNEKMTSETPICNIGERRHTRSHYWHYNDANGDEQTYAPTITFIRIK
jgi:hypothetical protein